MESYIDIWNRLFGLTSLEGSRLAPMFRNLQDPHEFIRCACELSVDDITNLTDPERLQILRAFEVAAYANLLHNVNPRALTQNISRALALIQATTSEFVLDCRKTLSLREDQIVALQQWFSAIPQAPEVQIPLIESPATNPAARLPLSDQEALNFMTEIYKYKDSGKTPFEIESSPLTVQIYARDAIAELVSRNAKAFDADAFAKAVLRAVSKLMASNTPKIFEANMIRICNTKGVSSSIIEILADCLTPAYYKNTTSIAMLVATTIIEPSVAALLLKRLRPAAEPATLIRAINTIIDKCLTTPESQIQTIVTLSKFTRTLGDAAYSAVWSPQATFLRFRTICQSGSPIPELLEEVISEAELGIAQLHELLISNETTLTGCEALVPAILNEMTKKDESLPSDALFKIASLCATVDDSKLPSATRIILLGLQKKKRKRQKPILKGLFKSLRTRTSLPTLTAEVMFALKELVILAGISVNSRIKRLRNKLTSAPDELHELPTVGAWTIHLLFLICNIDDSDAIIKEIETDFNLLLGRFDHEENQAGLLDYCPAVVNVIRATPANHLPRSLLAKLLESCIQVSIGVSNPGAQMRASFSFVCSALKSNLEQISFHAPEIPPLIKMAVSSALSFPALVELALLLPRPYIGSDLASLAQSIVKEVCSQFDSDTTDELEVLLSSLKALTPILPDPSVDTTPLLELISRDANKRQLLLLLDYINSAQRLFRPVELQRRITASHLLSWPDAVPIVITLWANLGLSVELISRKLADVPLFDEATCEAAAAALRAAYSADRCASSHELMSFLSTALQFCDVWKHSSLGVSILLGWAADLAEAALRSPHLRIDVVHSRFSVVERIISFTSRALAHKDMAVAFARIMSCMIILDRLAHTGASTFQVATMILQAFRLEGVQVVPSAFQQCVTAASQPITLLSINKVASFIYDLLGASGSFVMPTHPRIEEESSDSNGASVDISAGTNDSIGSDSNVGLGGSDQRTRDAHVAAADDGSAGEDEEFDDDNNGSDGDDNGIHADDDLDGSHVVDDGSGPDDGSGGDDASSDRMDTN
eukprot:TRINITY_DN4535_c0_g1_i1.p1 TRINITY_DN4535_c0_g1~~TRINITY_DN4535_c0_g1_i1.p1  ORF type:complete len:1059 (-),score=166.95 TRINITY_DN4535_c0_g1_i1:53-3229(-)